MDKLLESKFKLKGARPPPPAFMAMPAPPAESDPTMSTANCIPPIYKRSPVSSQTSSTNDTESTYVGSSQSQKSRGCEQELPSEAQKVSSGIQGLEKEKQKEQSQEQDTEVGVQEQSHCDNGEEAAEKRERHHADDQRATQELAIVAYNIQPGGRVAHVNVFRQAAEFSYGLDTWDHGHRDRPARPASR